MDAELAAASSFLASYLPASPTTSSRFATSLAGSLAERYENHFDVADPERGSAYRALVRLGPSAAGLDATVRGALKAAGLQEEVAAEQLAREQGRGHQLGDRWTMWLDPGSVCLRLEGGRSAGREGKQSREGEIVEIYGRVPSCLAAHSKFASTTTPATSSSTPEPMDAPSSPSKRSRAIQIVAPLSRGSSGLAVPGMSSSSLPRSASPLSFGLSSAPMPPVFATVTPPTPMRPAHQEDIFSSSPATVTKPAASLANKLSNLSLSAPRELILNPTDDDDAAASTEETPRPLSRQSMNGGDSGSDSEAGSGSERGSIFSLSAESLSSSYTSSGTHLPRSSPAGIAQAEQESEFKFPALPSRAASAAPATSSEDPQARDMAFEFPPRSMSARGHHHHSSSSSSMRAPPTPNRGMLSLPGSLPGSPSKSGRKRGTRGGQGGEGGRGHEHTSSISSIVSVSSTSSAVSSASTSRTRAQALQGTFQEHSGGKVGILGGGVLLGLAGGKAPSAGTEKRRSRERKRRDVGASGSQDKPQGHWGGRQPGRSPAPTPAPVM